MARRKILGTFQMLWDCEGCGTKKLLGKDHRHCPNCGAVQDETRRYLPAQSEAIPTTYSPAADNECDYCGTPNAYSANNCVNCGGSMAGTETVRKRAPTSSMAETVEGLREIVDEHKKSEQPMLLSHRQYPHREKENERAREKERHKQRERAREKEYEQTRREAENENRSVAGQPTVPTSRFNWTEHRVKIGVGAGLFTILGLIWMFAFWQKTVEVEVDSRYWERSQIIERFKAVSADDWCSAKPHDAYNISSASKVHHHETVVDCYNCDCHQERYKSGETCREVCSNSREPDGAGGYNLVQSCHSVCDPTYDHRQVCEDRTHQEPVYQPYCHYKLDRWRSQRTEQDSGGASLEPTWPVIDYRKCLTAKLGCERPGSKSQKYVVHFDDLDDPEKYECEWGQGIWAGYEVGSRWQAIVKVIGGRFQCDSLTRSE